MGLRRSRIAIVAGAQHTHIRYTRAPVHTPDVSWGCAAAESPNMAVGAYMDLAQSQAQPGRQFSLAATLFSTRRTMGRGSGLLAAAAVCASVHVCVVRAGVRTARPPGSPPAFGLHNIKTV